MYEWRFANALQTSAVEKRGDSVRSGALGRLDLVPCVEIDRCRDLRVPKPPPDQLTGFFVFSLAASKGVVPYETASTALLFLEEPRTSLPCDRSPGVIPHAVSPVDDSSSSRRVSAS